jgi:lipoprotein NlpD
MPFFPPVALPNSGLRVAIAIACMALLVAGCATRRPAPVEDRATTRTQAPVVVVPPANAPAAPAAAQSAPVPTYTVKRGDTLHQIALDTGLDYRELAAWNNIENVNVIRVGQVLRLTPPGEPAPVAQDAVAAGSSGVVTMPLRGASPVVESGSGAAAAGGASSAPGASTAPAVSSSASAGTSRSATSAAATPSTTSRSSDASLKTAPKAIKEPYSDQAVRELTLAATAVPAPTEKLAMAQPGGVRSEPAPAPRTDAKADSGSAAAPAPSVSPPPATAGDPDHLDWAWPTKGKVIAGYSDTANLKGIDIAGTAGQAIYASAPGRVVYAGNGLRGYGKLIIIKHNATYLSAYAHNREILVKEGQQVTRGQKIAEMGNTDADQVKLHFEIRRQGKPMDPSKYLPPA